MQLPPLMPEPAAALLPSPAGKVDGALSEAGDNPFASLLGQALNQQTANQPANQTGNAPEASPESASMIAGAAGEVPAEPAAALSENLPATQTATVISNDNPQGRETQSTEESGKPAPTIPAGFPLNLLATLQGLMQPLQPPAPVQPASEAPNTATPIAGIAAAEVSSSTISSSTAAQAQASLLPSITGIHAPAFDHQSQAAADGTAPAESQAGTQPQVAADTTSAFANKASVTAEAPAAEAETGKANKSSRNSDAGSAETGIAGPQQDAAGLPESSQAVNVQTATPEAPVNSIPLYAQHLAAASHGQSMNHPGHPATSNKPEHAGPDKIELTTQRPATQNPVAMAATVHATEHAAQPAIQHSPVLGQFSDAMAAAQGQNIPGEAASPNSDFTSNPLPPPQFAETSVKDEPLTPAPPLTVSAANSGAEEIAPAMFDNAPALTAIAHASGQGNKSEKALQALQDVQSRLSELNGQVESLSQPTSGAHPVLGESNIQTASHAADFETALSETSGPAESMAQPGGATETANTSIEPNAGQISGTSGASAASPPVENGKASGNNPLNFASMAQHPVDQVVEGTAYSVKNGHKELILRLNPDNLGEVRINLISHGNQEMSARLIASTPESHELLQNQLHTLKSSLEAQGIQIERMSVVLAGGTENRSDLGQGNQQNFQQSQQQNQSANHKDFNQQQDQANQSFNFNAGQGFQQGKPGYSQNPTGHRYGATAPGGEVASEPGNARHEGRTAQANDNGRISILA